MSDVVLCLENAGRTYPGTPPVESLRGIDLTVRTGEMVAVAGPSGSSKTTLLDLAAGLDRPTTGSIRLAGQVIENLSDRRLSGLRAYVLGVVFQQFFLIVCPQWTMWPTACSTVGYRRRSAAGRRPRPWTGWAPQGRRRPQRAVSFDLKTAGLALSTDHLKWLVVTPDGKFGTAASMKDRRSNSTSPKARGACRPKT